MEHQTRTKWRRLIPRSRRAAAVILALAASIGGASAERQNPNTDWFRDARWGVFVHYLWDVQNAGTRTNNLGRTTSWDECVKEFDTEKFAEQVKSTKAPYVFFTVMQRTRYLIAPNATCDRLTGYQPGEACSTRDLVEDLYRSLNKRGIKLLLYYTGDGPREDAQAAKGMGGWNGKVNDSYVANWAAVAREYSTRYGDKVKGWWVDGCYSYIGYNDARWQTLAAALKAGNPRAIVALNNPQMVRSNSSTDAEDFTTGEQNSFTEIPESRWRDGKQFHVLSYLGPDWGKPEARYDADYMADYVSAVNEAGGVVTIDVALFRDGSIDPTQLRTLQAMSAQLPLPGARRESWKTRPSVPPGNLACWKPARILSLDGTRPLEVNGGGGRQHAARFGVDGQASTDAQGAGEWPWTYEVDLVDPASISRAVVTFGQNYATEFELRVSLDRQQWSTVTRVTDHGGGKKELSFTPTHARYVQLRGLKPDGPDQKGGQMSVAELELYSAAVDPAKP